ncbi:flavin reductase family protein [Alteromonas stellipolaris]|uniref:flavin reductase family protein n=1 Tax=Alteromonas stellipolaris TaxID=233316 RepID=UPI002735A51B|nr:flavin reductase family protein [Alteromonas stellipolaris]MDP2538111.1 flavin reductase family protein [Alteromonas stellipolaris]
MSDIHFYEPKVGHGLAHDPFNAIIAPRPIGWISSKSKEGKLNLAPYSFFNALNYTPPIIGFSSVGDKDSLKNIKATGEFCWNLVSKPLVEAMNQTSAPLAADEDEFVFAALDTVASHIVDVPRVKLSPVSMECKLTDIVQLKNAEGGLCESWFVMGEVVGVHIQKNMIEAGVYKTLRAEPVMRGGGAGDYFTVDSSNMFELFRPK